MTKARVSIQKLPHGADLDLPSYASSGASGVDLRAAIKAGLTLKPGGRAAIPTGICIALPEGTEGQIRPRSGIALRDGVSVLNAPGTIDSDYRGEIQVILVNHSREPYVVQPGHRIAQLVVAPVARIEWQPVSVLPESERGDGGFGSTGS